MRVLQSYTTSIYKESFLKDHSQLELEEVYFSLPGNFYFFLHLWYIEGN